jgi:hypothetical protein
MTFLLDFQTCFEVDDALLDQAFASGSSAAEVRDRVMRLLERLARIAKPRQGAHRVFEVLARLARVDWLSGSLDVVVRDFGVATEIDIRVDEGTRFGHLRTLSLGVPLAELRAWVETNPSALVPLAIFGQAGASELRLRVAGPVSSRRGRSSDVHSADTQPNQMTAIPEEAYRPSPGRREAKPTVRMPAIKTPVEPRDPEDEGWG